MSQFPPKISHTPPTEPSQAERATVASILNEIEKAMGKPKVRQAADEDIGNFAGKQVSEVRTAIMGVFDMPADALAFVNGKPVSEEYVLQRNDKLEFLKQSGPSS